MVSLSVIPSTLNCLVPKSLCIASGQKCAYDSQIPLRYYSLPGCLWRTIFTLASPVRLALIYRGASGA